MNLKPPESKNSKFERMEKLRGLSNKSIAGAALALSLFGLTACSDGGGETAPKHATATSETTAVPRNPAEVQFMEVEHQARESLLHRAGVAAEIVLSILSNPKSGTGNESKYEVGNKAALVGPNSAEYEQFPESLARYYPETKQINIRAIIPEAVTGEPEKYFSVDTLFKVSDENPITSLNSNLTVEDFRAALGDKNTISLVALSAQEGVSFDEKTKQSTGTGGGIRLAYEGIIPEEKYGGIPSSLSVADALSDRLADPSKTLKDTDSIVSTVNSLITVLDIADNHLVPYARR